MPLTQSAGGHQRNNILTLPPELLANIFAFIRTDADLGAVTLVCRAFRNAMAKGMWEVTCTSLKPSDAKDFEALVHPESGFVKHIKYLYMNHLEEPEEADDERLVRLLSAVPEDKLRNFGSQNHLSVAALHALLERQRNLEIIDVPDLVEIIQNESEDLVFSALRGVTKYYMCAPKDSKDEEQKKEHYRICRQLINKFKKLKGFRVSSDLVSHRHGELVDVQHLFRGEDGDLELCRLTEIALDDIDLAPSIRIVLRNINLDVLQDLHLYNCSGLTEFLNGLSHMYAKRSGPLKCVAIELEYMLNDRSSARDAVERFLNTSPKLTSLFLNLIDHFAVDAKCLTRHAETLTSLYYNVSNWPIDPGYLSLWTFIAIVKGCHMLRDLTINTKSVYLDDLPDVADDWILGPGRFDTMHVKSELESELDVIAAHPTLTSLRFLDPPTFDWHTNDGMPQQNSKRMARHCRILMQNFADQVLRYLSARGSKIKLLITKPDYIPTVRPAKDQNNHQWPMYAYTKGYVTDARGVKNVVAVPLPYVRLEMWEQRSMASN